MRVYVGQTRSRQLIAKLSALGFGECTQPREWPPRRHPWFLDNAAFSAWRLGRPFDDAAFSSALLKVAADGRWLDFGVCPDIVAGGLASLAFSLDWRTRCESALPGQRWYLAAQDGMEAHDVDAHIANFAGIFVGGSLPWKLRRAAEWVEYAHRRGVQCHIGRVGTEDRVRWARRIGADSIDSCLPLWSADNLARFLRGLDEHPAQTSWC